MAEKAKVVIKTGRRGESASKKFSFTSEMVNTSSDSALGTYRAEAWSAFENMDMPTVRDEAWRRTDLRKMPLERFRIPAEGAFNDLPAVPEALLKPLVGEAHGGQVTLLPGGAEVSLSSELAAKGVVFTDFRTAEKEHPELLTKLAGNIVRAEDGKFAALAAALSQNGVLLYVPRGVQVEEPLHSVLWGPGADLAHLSHVIVHVEEGASVTYVHESASPDEEGTHTFHAGLVEINVADGANLRFVELQSWGKHVWNFSHERVHVGRDANLDWVFGAVGSRLTKNFSDLDLVGQGAAGRMSGFYFTDGTQHLDHDTQQNHLVPNTSSDLLFKGALKGKSRSVWQGMIYVAPGAQKTDGYQANRNLILSEDARADSIPGLEISADDVRCTHGATIGKIDPEPLFYLRSRGITEEDAQRLVVEGFFDPIMQRIPFEGVRERFQQAIKDKLD
ncbi:MAG: Fe-S cluster assembly protein SufD [Anaerolineae bacterium]|jgi:Fe-S cluster assembly protein SufD|nr:Fe-S cluster assembly protein SufD [Anaerolineae bacterium]MBT7069334.1 Fe-S cluster assembly protein SufD [Anaerolineae bacterium]MBT7325950.1 Fe-S cluster assembly protein SufD [Anaerolineae bacterium]